MGTIRIIYRDSRPFRDREDAGGQLARELLMLRGKQAVFLGIPRGGIVIADILARTLDGELDIVLTRKLGAPGNPELAVGAVSENGAVILNEAISSATGAFAAYIEREKNAQLAVIERRAAEYRRIIPKISLTGRYVVVTDDGIATGATMEAALRTIRNENPERLIAAAPVGAADSVERLAARADEIVCLRVPPWFGGVGQFYEEFPQTEDRDVLQILRAEAERKVAK